MSRSTKRSFQPLIAAAFVAVACFVALSYWAQEARPHYLLSVPIRSQADLVSLAASGLDIAGVNRNAGTASVVASEADFEKIAKLGLPYNLIDVSHPLRQRGEALSDYTDPQEMSAFLDQVQAAYPSIAKKYVIKDPLFEGQVQVAMKITKDVDQENQRPVFFLDGQHHAREVMTAEITKDAVDYLTSRYATDPQVQHWVDNIEIWIVTIVNPDGAMYVFTNDNMWRKNRHPSCGVDNNRNYDWNWASCYGSDDFCASETYHGTAGASEPETQGMISVMAGKHPVFNLTYHSYGEYLLYPLGCTDPNEMGSLGDIAQALNGILENDQGHTGQYATGPSWSTIYVTDGSSDDEAYGKYGVFSYCIEVNSTDFQPDYATWRDVTVRRQRTAWQFFLDETLNAPSIRGRVTDESSGLPVQAGLSLQEVTFTHGEEQRRADERGFYHWVTQANKTYHITFSQPGYMSQTHEVSVGSGPATLDVSLTPSDPGSVPHDPVPADGAHNEALSITLSWQATASGGFDVYLGNSSDPPKVASVSDTTYSTPALETGKTYYWKIVAVTASGPVSGPVWSFSTLPYGVTSVKKEGNPFRLYVYGSGFQDGCFVTLNGTQAPQTVFQGSDRLLLKKGSALKALAPKGTPIQVVVKDSSGGASPPFTFQW
jgi:carboxypeptidase T